jgi:hypothetical protein
MELVYSGTWVHILDRQKAKSRANLRPMAKRKTKAPARSEGVPARKHEEQPTHKVGRPRAKHSDPDYIQMSLYIHRTVRSEVKMRLFETGGEFSALVESLLREWLKKHDGVGMK